MPEKAWPRISAACEAGEPLPAPLAHASAVGAISVLASVLGAILRAGRSGGTVALELLVSAAAYLGAAAIAVWAGPRFIEVPDDVADLVPRFAAAAFVPIAASGSFNFVPLGGVTLVWMLAGIALTARSGWIGAADLLGLEGEPRVRAATVVTVAGGAPVLLFALFRLFS